MLNIHFDANDSDDERRTKLYDGDIYVYSPSPAALEFCSFVKQMIVEAFGPLDPETAQFHMEVNDYAELLGRLKPSFIHHPESKSMLSQVLGERGCDRDLTFFEVPKLRSSTSDRYLTAGIAYAWHPHRDTWYSAPNCQINWWMPVYPITRDNCMAFHPRYWAQPLENTSSGYNYYEWNEKYRGTQVTKYINHDPRPLPAAKDPIAHDSDIRLLCPPGGLILFSGAQLHSSVPNTSGKTRFSVDFRTAHSDDLVSGRGAPNVDSACTGTVLREFKRGSDFSNLPEDIVKQFEDGTEKMGRAVFSH